MPKKAVALLLCCLLTAAAIPALTEGEIAYEKRTMRFFDTFDTVVTIMGYTQTQEAFDEITRQAQEQFAYYHKVFDAYNAYEGLANLFVLNRDGGSVPVRVEPELIDLLRYCQEKQAKTNGAFNVALGAVLSLWHDARESALELLAPPALPDMDALRAAAEHIDFASVIIDEAAGTVAFTDSALLLDVGAVAKGYTAEVVAQWIATTEMPSYLISAGGNVRVGAQPLDGRQRWGVSVQHPDAIALGDPDVENLDVLYVTDTSVVTSGDYQRYFVVDGKRYHHIISPDTLMPSDLYRSVTVVCEDSGWADILSTALFIMPYDEGRALVDATDGVDALWMLADGTVEMTDGIREIAKSQGASARD